MGSRPGRARFGIADCARNDQLRFGVLPAVRTPEM